MQKLHDNILMNVLSVAVWSELLAEEMAKLQMIVSELQSDILALSNQDPTQLAGYVAID